MNNAILAPAAVLIAWTLVITLWLLISRLRAFNSVGVDLRQVPRGSRYGDIEPTMPERANWVSHNYTHLLEQPTVFYGLVAILAIAGADNSPVIWAWGYTLLRIAHSMWQLTANVVIVRILLFLASNACLLMLSYHSLRITLF